MRATKGFPSRANVAEKVAVKQQTVLILCVSAPTEAEVPLRPVIFGKFAEPQEKKMTFLTRAAL